MHRNIRAKQGAGAPFLRIELCHVNFMCFGLVIEAGLD
jgi:hypothetical protein